MQLMIALIVAYVEGREEDIEKYEENLNEAIKIMRSSIENIERIKMGKSNNLKDLWKQGWKRENGQWIRLEENERGASKS
ncbi:hypothetical protein SAMN04488156_1112 [Bacillus sp. 166amftsu]|nr:hypothetical protein SAMN04488156_1112 [Bacillus sp. 166amftsu]